MRLPVRASTARVGDDGQRIPERELGAAVRDDQPLAAPDRRDRAFGGPAHILELLADQRRAGADQIIDDVRARQGLQAHLFLGVLLLDLARDGVVVGAHDAVARQDADGFAGDRIDHRQAFNAALPHVAHRRPERLVGLGRDHIPDADLVDFALDLAAS